MEVLCYRCFAAFPAQRLRFRCPMHQPAHEFEWQAGRFARRPPRAVPCPLDRLWTGYRVCPNCHRDLPYYAGRVRQQVVAVAGCSTTGKTVYLWAVLHRLQVELAREESPHAVALFEDAASFELYRELSRSIEERGEVPELTQAARFRAGELSPVVVRLLGDRAVRNLVFFDPSGELIENLDETAYLCYLAQSAALLYLVEPPCGDRARDQAQAARASDGLAAVARQMRQQAPHLGRGLIRRPLAVVLSKGDDYLFGREGPEVAVQVKGGSAFWRGRRWSAEVDRASECCRSALRRHGYDELLAQASNNFAPVRYFAVSGLGAPPRDGRLTAPARPVAIEAPLFWAMSEVG
jgi:hypothetical protein